MIYGNHDDRNRLTKEEQATIHGNNERMTTEAVKRSVEFYIRLIKNS